MQVDDRGGRDRRVPELTADEVKPSPGSKRRPGVGVPRCVEPDPGFAPGQDVPDEVLDSAPTCAVHPRYAVTDLLMVTDSANSFIAAYGAAAAPTTCAN